MGPKIRPSPEQVAAEEARKMREKQEAIRKARVIKLQQDAAHEAIKEAFSKDPTNHNLESITRKCIDHIWSYLGIDVCHLCCFNAVLCPGVTALENFVNSFELFLYQECSGQVFDQG